MSDPKHHDITDVIGELITKALKNRGVEIDLTFAPRPARERRLSPELLVALNNVARQPPAQVVTSAPQPDFELPEWRRLVNEDPGLGRHVNENMMQILRGADWLAHVAGRERNKADVHEATRLFLHHHGQHVANVEALIKARGY